MLTNTSLSDDLKADIAAIGRINAIPTILEVICRTTGMGFAAVARVTDEKWIACSVRDEIQFGLLPGGELDLETTICHEIRQIGQGVIIDHVAEDPKFCTHHTPTQYGFQSYISIPVIKKDGSFFGTLCAIDPRPAKLNNPETIGMFNLYADLIAFHLNALEELTITENKLLEEQQLTKLREQFIAILGHDLRNPVGAVKNVAQLILRGVTDEARLQRLAAILQDSSHRMIGLIDNVMDFARGKLGGGINLDNGYRLLEKPLTHVIDELQVVWPNRVIEYSLNINGPVYSDDKRIAQLFSNLLSNALTHGNANKPVKVKAIIEQGDFVLAITNSGGPIPDAVMGQLFQPFARGGIKAGQEGLGLGLYIASEIARAHGGSIAVANNIDEIIFTVKIPVHS